MAATRPDDFRFSATDPTVGRGEPAVLEIKIFDAASALREAAPNRPLGPDGDERRERSTRHLELGITARSRGESLYDSGEPGRVMFEGIGKYLQSSSSGTVRRMPPLEPTETSPWHRNAEPNEELYERHGRVQPPSFSRGAGDSVLIGRTELEILRIEGLTPSYRVVDFGYDTERLAVHLIPFLEAGACVGVDSASPELSKLDASSRGKCPSRAAPLRGRRRPAITSCSK